eukprot:snap_masked-scaffold_4-processed-gene-9.10-mRNA-1 protein AED:1.00 eAED:1.00 QI:0/0/0/0/1/1/2/0/302
MQRFIGVQSLEHFLGFKVDLCYLREKFYEKGCYKKKILPYSERQCLLKRLLTLWRFGSMEVKKSDLDKVDVTLVYDIMRLPGLIKLHNMISCCRKNGDIWKGYPKYKGDLGCFEEFINDLIKKVRLKKVSQYVELVYLAVNTGEVGEQLKGRKLSGISDEVASNLFSYRNEELGVYDKIWKILHGSRMIKQDVQEFLKSTELKPQVVIVDFPYNLFSGDPIRGPSNNYDQMKDKDIMALDVSSLGKDNLWFVWTLASKRKLAVKWLEKNEIKFMSRLLWVKTSKSGKLLSTLGNISGACVAE